MIHYGSICSGIEAAKSCAICKCCKPLNDFYKHKGGPQGRHSYCKQCYTARCNGQRKRRYSPQLRRSNNLWARYRLRGEDYQGLLASQGGVCALCSLVPRRSCVDHDHATGRVRGILCHRCNLLIAGLERGGFTKRALVYLGRLQ